MVYGFYKNIRNAAWQAIIDFNITSLPVSVNNISKNLNVKMIKNSDVNKLKPGERGLTIYSNQNWYIIFDNSEAVPICRYTVAHELAHILLGHIMTDEVKYRTFVTRDETEQSADMFASRLLAPACVLHELQALTGPEIAKLCNISMTAANIRAKRMQELERRNMWYKHPLEIQVKNQFEQFIKENRYQNGNSDNGK